ALPFSRTTELQGDRPAVPGARGRHHVVNLRKTSRAPAAAGLSRRELARFAGSLILGGALPSRASAAGPAAAAVAPAPDAAPDLYRDLGVRPLINCRGTVTVIGGSIELPEVRAAKSLANQQHVQLDELMEAAGKRLAELTGAEWGMVTAGCAAAMSHATAACVAGGNPDLHVRIPDLTGFPKDEVIVPGHSRNVYDAAIRAVGVKVIEVETPEELGQAIGPKTAMIYIFANSRNEEGPMSLEAVAALARPHGIPVLVDAAAEVLTIPNVHLQRGATLVCYSGGKIIRGPQSAGLLLGRKDLVQAAWIHSAPHHGYARAMKVGREEIVGMLVAVESWVKRDHDAEWQGWIARAEHIASAVSNLPGVTALVRREPGGRSNRSPRVAIRWDSAALGITGAEAADILDTTEPRIALGGGGGGGGGGGRSAQEEPGDTGISLNMSMMAPGDEKIVASRVRQVLSARHTPRPAAAPKPPATDLTGQWEVAIRYRASTTVHAVHLQQTGNQLAGRHHGNFIARDITGTIDGNSVSLASTVTERHGDSLRYGFTGTVAGDAMSGTLEMGEYLDATWTARRHLFGEPA
ncbi:MAG: aminotransferase class V-fold PLP-dependent enzyme, partial [Vicinamibacteraceae bacterium]